MVCIKRQRSSYTDILTEDLILNGLHLEEQKRRRVQAQKKKGKKKTTKNPPNPVYLPSCFGEKQRTALKLIALHSNKYMVLDYSVF